MFQFAWPLMALLLPVPLLVYRFLPPASENRGGTLFAPFAAGLAPHASGASPVTAHRLALLASSLIWILIVIAGMRPQWLGDPIPLAREGRNLMLAIDISGSMETADMAGGRATRLDAVKHVAGEFLKRRKGDRVGLILFGSRAYLQSPLTFDRTTVAKFLGDSVVGLAGRETAISDAIGRCLKSMKDAPEGETVLVLLTDGANTAGALDPIKAAELAAKRHLKIYTIGFGSDSRSANSFFLRRLGADAQMDETTLKKIAKMTGGQYFRATSVGSLVDIYRQLDKLEPVAGNAETVRPVDELFIWPLGAALTLSLLWGLTPVIERLREVTA